jgi:hypothetical protein
MKKRLLSREQSQTLIEMSQCLHGHRRLARRYVNLLVIVQKSKEMQEKKICWL